MDFETFYHKEWVSHMEQSGALRVRMQMVLGAVSALFSSNVAMIALLVAGAV